VERKIPARFWTIKNRPRRFAIFVIFAGLFACSDGQKSPEPSGEARVETLDPELLRFPALRFGAPPADAPRRIVCVIPSATEILFALGLGDRQVGRSDWCDYPPEVAQLPSLGRQQDLSAEKIADLKPDLVISWRHLPDLSRALGILGLRVVTPETENRDHVFAGIAAVAAAAHVPERGDALIAAVQAQLAEVRARYAGAPRRRVLLVLDRNPLYAPGRASFLDEMLGTVGAENVAAAPDGPAWVQFSAEKILDWNPEVVIDLSVGDPSDAARSAAYWAQFPQTEAVRRGRVRTAAGGVLVRPGPRMAGVAALLGRWIHEP
jgi:iron complex transport system substrate-binding protein